MHSPPSWTSPTRAAILALLLLPALASGQGPGQGKAGEEDDPRKVSNDQPSRPLQMPAASNEAKEAFEDFDRFKRRGAWERATKALYSIPDAQMARFVDGTDGFIIPVGRKRHAVLAGLSAEGLAAYRLFYDADAKKMLESAEGPTEQATLEKLFSAYFLTTVGDNAADRLGDLYFEQGRFDRAADCYLAIFRERTDTDLSLALAGTKAALALARANRRSEARAVRAELVDRHADELVSIAGRKAKPAEHLKALDADPTGPKPDASTGDDPAPVFAETVPAAWQVRFGDSIRAGMTAGEASQWHDNDFSYAVPRVAVDGPNLYANYLNHVFAVELATGKLLWRSGSFHNAEVAAMGDQARMIDAARYAILAAPGYVWTLGKDLKDNNMMATAQITCRRAGDGEVVWQTKDFADYVGIDLVGLPILAGDLLLIAGKSTPNNFGQDNIPRQFVLAIRPRDGKLLWKTEVGVFREAQQRYYFYMKDNSPQPRLAYHAGSIFVDTHVGVLARIDAASGVLEWGYGYPTDPVKGQSMFFFYGMPQDPTPIGSPPLTDGEALLVKGAKSDQIAAIDPDRMKVLWTRPIGKATRAIGADAQAIYLGGGDLEAFDRQTKVLRWALPMPDGGEQGEVLVRPDGLWQFTPRGVYEVDPKLGRVRRIFRGDDTGAAGGDLLLTDRWLLTVSNRTIAAYPRGGKAAERAAGVDPAADTRTRGSDD